MPSALSTLISSSRQKRRAGTGSIQSTLHGYLVAAVSVFFIVIFGLERLAISILECGQFGSSDGSEGASSSSQAKSLTPPRFPWDAAPLPRELQLSYSAASSPSLIDRSHPLVLMKNRIPLTRHYKFPQRQFDGDCSCRNPKSTIECCSRTFRRSHKMGCVMSMALLQQYPNQYKLAAEPKFFTYNLELPSTDYRDVIVLRDLYSSILSGYLYHHKGFECRMPDKIRDYLGEWDKHVGYELRPPANGRSICQYLKRTRPATGMRAYVAWVMRYYYAPIFAHWAMAQEIGEMKERTLTVCYEDLMSKDRDLETVHSIVDFFFDGAPPVAWDGTPPGHAKVEGGYKGGHSTTNDRTQEDKENLIQVIKTIDENFYHGEIAWLNSINPCGGKTK